MLEIKSYSQFILWEEDSVSRYDKQLEYASVTFVKDERDCLLSQLWHL